MAWVAANLFVQTDDQRALVDALLPLLRDDALRADREGLLDAPPPLAISPARERWIAVTGLRGWVEAPPELARRLSEAMGQVVTSELLGHFFRLRHTVHSGGVQRAIVRAPEVGWGPADAALIPMPLYRDVEQLAYALLLDLQIPRELALIGTRPAHANAAATLALEGGLSIVREAEGLRERQAPTETVDYSGDLAPVLVKEIGRDFGLTLYDDRFVEGFPSDKAVERLIQLEEKIKARASELFGAPAQLHVTYYSGEYQDELDRLLIARDRRVPLRPDRQPATPWWQFWRHFGRFK